MLKKMLMIYPNNQPLLNIKYMITTNNDISSIKLSNKTIVIHTGGEKSIVKNWNPKGDKRISGSEYMAINLAKEFINFGYRVFIIGSFYNDKENINYQCIYEEIEYIDYKFFSEFCLKYIIDFLIVSRYVSDLIYYNNVKSVYLWVHDPLPIMFDNNSRCIQNHKEKFKGIITVSKWQRDNIIKELNIPEKNFILSRNAIYLERFTNKKINKIPYRFIYASAPDRGLDILIKYIPKIKEKYPETTLEIFVNKNEVDIDTTKKINELSYVNMNERLSQDEICKEYLKSDIWFYPTEWPETYCITALEAMAAKCLVVSVDYCGLGNVIEGKGIICKSPVSENIDNLLQKLFFTLDKPQLKKHFIEKAYNWAIKQTYEQLAEEWINNILI
jgi:glycosyltransferase involved in cell wall biosynthesis